MSWVLHTFVTHSLLPSPWRDPSCSAISILAPWFFWRGGASCSKAARRLRACGSWPRQRTSRLDHSPGGAACRYPIVSAPPFPAFRLPLPPPRSSFSFSSVLLAFPVGPASGRDQWATSALFPFVCPALLLCCPRARGERRFSDFVNRSQVDPVLPQRRNGDGTREYKSTTGRSSPVLRCCFSALSSSSSLRGRVGSLAARTTASGRQICGPSRFASPAQRPPRGLAKPRPRWPEAWPMRSKTLGTSSLLLPPSLPPSLSHFSWPSRNVWNLSTDGSPAGTTSRSGRLLRAKRGPREETEQFS